MSKDYRLILLIAGLLVIAALTGAYALLPAVKPIRINAASCAAIQRGMSQREVEAILGAPPGDYETPPAALVLDLYGGGVFMHEGRLEQWRGNDGFIQVVFGSDDTVHWSRFVQAYPVGRKWTFIERYLGRALW